MTEEAYQKQSQFFSALSHPVRLRILDILTQDEACVCHLCATLQQRQAYVSQQLAILKDAGLISDRKDGLYVYYSLADEELSLLMQKARRCLVDLTGDESLLQAQVPRHGEINCSCPKCQANPSKP